MPEPGAISSCRHCGASLAPIAGESLLVARLADEVDVLREELSQLRTPEAGLSPEASPDDDERARLHRVGAMFIVGGVSAGLLLYVALAAWLGVAGTNGFVVAVPALLLVVASTGWGVHLVRRAQAEDQ